MSLCGTMYHFLILVLQFNTGCFNHYDQANICEIDPDINYIGEENAMKCK